MEFSVWQPLVAGFVGTVAMVAMTAMGKAMGMTKMDMPLMLGGMLTGDEGRARSVGQVIHFFNGTVIFGLIYAVVLSAIPGAAWWTAAWLGLIHGLVAVVVLPMMGAMHPRVAVEGAPDALPMVTPGFGGRNFGAGTPMGLVVGHVAYGVVFGVVYAALI